VATLAFIGLLVGVPSTQAQFPAAEAEKDEKGQPPQQAPKIVEEGLFPVGRAGVRRSRLALRGCRGPGELGHAQPEVRRLS
jgi:hypothetical protein